MAETLVPPTVSEARLRRELEQAYDQLTEITSRLLLANEAAEAALSGEDRTAIAAGFLKTAARGLEVRRAALFLVEGDGFAVGATYGLDEAQDEALASSEADIEACQRALEAGLAHVVDPGALAADALEAIAAAPDAPPAGEEDEEDAEGGADDEPDSGDEEEEEDEEDEEEEDEEDAEEDEAEEEGTEDADAGEEADDDEAPGPAAFALYVPVRIEADAVAVMGLGERAANRTYRHEDLIFLQYLLRQFALTLNRSTLLEQIQERLEEHAALLKVSREITSTLDLDAVLRSVVNTVAVVVENDRAEIALLRGDRLQLRTVSGMTRLDSDQTELFKLGPPLEYLRTHPRRFQVCAEDLGGDRPLPGEDVFAEYFSSQQMRSFMALPLGDDQGLLGFLCLESRLDAWSIEPSEGDTLSILSAQATVAIRNAQLYSEIPLRGVSLPVSRLRAKVAELTARGRVGVAVAAVATLAGLLLPIFPHRAGGPAEVRPLQIQAARTLSAGTIARTLVSGGEQVRRGQPLAEIEDLDLAGRLADLRARIEVARRDVAAARRAGDLAGWREGELRLAGLNATLGVEERRSRATLLTAPFDGQILELDLAQRVGQYLEAGDSFCAIAALGSVAVDFEVPEERIGRVRTGQEVALKVMSYPTRVFRGRVIEVGWRGITGPGGRAHFTVRARVENPERALRPGMTGIARASLGSRPAGAALIEPVWRGILMAWS